MILEQTRVVGEDAVRPARPDGTCFYCRVPLGGEHNPECVMYEQTVVVEVISRIVVKGPAHWASQDFEFLYNESSSCANNVISELSDTADRLSDHGSCMCGHMEVRYLREATVRDHRAWALEVEEE
jgi:hypothetical protein